MIVLYKGNFISKSYFLNHLINRESLIILLNLETIIYLNKTKSAHQTYQLLLELFLLSVSDHYFAFLACRKLTKV